MVVAPSITWLLVSISPEDVSTMPVPAASTCWYPSVVLMSTSPGSTLAAMEEASPGPEEPDDPEEPDEPDPNEPDDPEPPDEGVELEAGDVETDDALLVQAKWPIPAPAAR